LNQNNLRIDYCSFKAADYAVKHWHYSKCMPVGKLVKYGVWEDDKFIGSVIFGYGANNNLAKSFKLKQTECCELVRVALSNHRNPVTRIISICIKLLKRFCSNLKLIVSYADKTNQKHLGIIYQAGNWLYLGERKTNKDAYYEINGRKIHGRSARAKYGNKTNFPIGWNYISQQTKYIYIYPLCKIIAEQYKKYIQQYPKGIASETNDTVNYPVNKGGVTPTAMLQTA